MPPKGIARGPSVLLKGSEPILEKGEVKKERLLGNPALAAGTKPMGYPKGRSGSSSLGSTTGLKPRGLYNLILALIGGSDGREEDG